MSGVGRAGDRAAHPAAGARAGPRTAVRAPRAALHLIRKKEELLAPLGQAMQVAAERITVCSSCGNIDTRDPCGICANARRDPS